MTTIVKTTNFIMTATKTTLKDSFLAKAKEKYPDQPYDYSKVQYVNKRTKITVTCTHHGDFYTTPNNFLSKVKTKGCPTCGRESGKKRSHYKKGHEPTDNFNVRGGTKKYQHLLLQIFE
ncbi:hypothetical protein P3666_21085 [Vibrio parahaemolyticus]|uniref:hypothetical protein n=1 Tax=Vibrio TaxID=662 RepID=UPI0004725198|nr:hypothetical protein [Vibrio parahaemolyticus]